MSGTSSCKTLGPSQASPRQDGPVPAQLTTLGPQAAWGADVCAHSDTHTHPLPAHMGTGHTHTDLHTLPTHVGTYTHK